METQRPEFTTRALCQMCAAQINALSFDKGAYRRGQDPNKGTKVLLGLSFLTLSPLLYFGAM